MFNRHRTVTSSVDEAEAHLRAVFERIAVQSDRLDYASDEVGDDRFLLASSTYVGGISCAAETRDYVISVAAPGGQWELGDRRGVFGGTATLFQPMQRPTARLDDLAIDSVVLDRVALERTARRIYADDSLSVAFSGPTPTTAEVGTQWSRVHGTARRARETLHNEMLRTTVYWGLAVCTLETFGLCGDVTRRVETVRGLDRAYRGARRFIDDHLHEAFPIEDMALTAGVSRIDLERAFHALDPHGRSVLQYLRHARLAQAHRELLDGDPAWGDTVRTIAERWGFTSPSSFTRQYRAVFGCTPSATLRR